MADVKRGYAMLITAGDAEISGALADGILAVRGTRDLIRLDAERRATFPIWGRLGEAKPLGREEARVVSAEIDRQRIAEALRQEMHPEPVDYAMKVADAELDYGEPLCVPGPLERFGARLLLGYALVVLAFDWLFKSVGT